MEVTSLLGPSALSPAAVDADRPAIASDFETFLRMLTVQMQNQDPLNPTKAEDFAIQLATFSGVEQAVYTNELLESLQGQMGLSGVSQFADWIGKEAKAPMDARFDGSTPITVSVAPDPTADESYLVVRNAAGVEFDRLKIPGEHATFDYDGVTAGGSTLPEGTYVLTVENWKNGGLDTVARADIYGRVVEARFHNGQTLLVMESGTEVTTDLVTALREPKPN